MNPLDRFPDERVWADECTRIVSMLRDLITVNPESITIASKDAETLLFLIAGLVIAADGPRK